MNLKDLVSMEFTQQELDDMGQYINGLVAIIAPKAINLTPEMRSKLGSIKERNKLFVQKAVDTVQNYPDFIPDRVLNNQEFIEDYGSRNRMEETIKKLLYLVEMFSDNKILLDHDVYQGSITMYRYSKFLSKENMPGATGIYNDLKQFFTNRGSSNTNPDDETPTNDGNDNTISDPVLTNTAAVKQAA